MHFEFTPIMSTPDKQEINLTFIIKQFSLTEKFLFQVYIIPPNIAFSTPKVDFGPLMLLGKS